MSRNESGTEPLYLVEVRANAGDHVVYSQLTVSQHDAERALIPVLWEHSTKTEAAAHNIARGLEYAFSRARAGKRSFAIEGGLTRTGVQPVNFEVIPIPRADPDMEKLS